MVMFVQPFFNTSTFDAGPDFVGFENILVYSGPYKVASNTSPYLTPPSGIRADNVFLRYLERNHFLFCLQF